MEKLKIKIKNKSGLELPAYSTYDAAGMDVRASLPDGPVTLKPFQRALIPTGLFVELPSGYELQVRPRSGLALKHGITVLNSPGTVDADYRGEIGVILINLGQEDFTIKDGERICQFVVKPYVKVEWEPATELDKTKREDGGFGHTGLK